MVWSKIVFSLNYNWQHCVRLLYPIWYYPLTIRFSNQFPIIFDSLLLNPMMNLPLWRLGSARQVAEPDVDLLLRILFVLLEINYRPWKKKQLYISFFYLYIMVDNLFESISGLFKNDFLKWWRGSAFNGATLELISLQWRIVIVRSHATQIGARMREKFKLEMKIQQLNPIPMGL